MSLINSAITTNSSQVLNSASTLLAQKRKHLAIEAIAGTATITELAQNANTSRKFIYAQKKKAEIALNKVFVEEKSEQEKVLFYLPITKAWLIQLVIALILICRSSYQGVIELLRDLFDSSISKGSIHNIMGGVLDKACQINQNQDLSRIRVCANDEIFQTGLPVLVGCDAISTYCYLLSQEAHRDGDTWGVHLLDLKQKQNLKPDYSIADGGTGLRKGQKDAWPDVPCRGDVFHALKPFLELAVRLDNRALGTISAQDAIEKKLVRPRLLTKQACSKFKTLQKQLIAVKRESQQAIQIADDVRTLYQWVKDDILSLVGPACAERQILFDFVVEALRAYEPLCAHSIQPVRSFLENNRDSLLQFAVQIDAGIDATAEEFGVNGHDVRALYELQRVPLSTQLRWKNIVVPKNWTGD
jgi:hypothetical protein